MNNKNKKILIISLLIFIIISGSIFLYYKKGGKLPPEKDRNILGYPRDFNRGKSHITGEHLFNPNYYFEHNGFVYYHQPSSISVSGHGSKARDFKLENSDPTTFQIIDSNYAKDKNQVYYWGVIVKKADPETFETLDWPRAKDKNYYFKQAEIIGEVEKNEK